MARKVMVSGKTVDLQALMRFIELTKTHRP